MNSGVYRDTMAAPSALPGAASTDRGDGLRVLRAEQLTSADVAAWSALEERAIEPNPFMSPHFVLPALRRLDPQARAEVWLVHRGPGASGQLIGACAFVRHRWSRQCPFPHVSAYRSRHSYLSGPLLDLEYAPQALERMLDHARSTSARGLAFVLPNVQADGPTAESMSAWGRRHGSRVHRADARSRAMLVPNQAGVDSLKKSLGSRLKEISRNRRRLADEGAVQWESFRPSEATAAIETFLRLEHTGWKLDEGSSLRSNRADEEFFEEMMAGFATQGRAWFTELRLNEKPIASTSNLISGGAGFAFKVGWDPEYRKYGVGILNEVELVQSAAQVCTDLRVLDSGAQPGSFIESLWPGRRELACLILPLGPMGRSLWRANEAARALKQRLWRIAAALPAARRKPAAGDA
jgi:Acetyltransferase (GNAT) domain